MSCLEFLGGAERRVSCAAFVHAVPLVHGLDGGGLAAAGADVGRVVGDRVEAAVGVRESAEVGAVDDAVVGGEVLGAPPLPPEAAFVGGVEDRVVVAEVAETVDVGDEVAVLWPR
jgi:hypothetical protein